MADGPRRARPARTSAIHETHSTQEPTIESKELALHIADEIAMQQGEDVTVLDVSGPLVIADYFVVATARNHRHAVSIARDLERSVKARGERRLHTSGTEGESSWILIDFDLVVVHLFEEQARQFYALEALWGDAPRVDYTPPERVAAATHSGSAEGGDRSPDEFDDFDDFPGGRFTGTVFSESAPRADDGSAADDGTAGDDAEFPGGPLPGRDRARDSDDDDRDRD